MSALEKELSRIEDFFRKAANSAVYGRADIIEILRASANLDILSEQIAELTEKEQLTGEECLRLSSAFFVYYIAGLASQGE